MSRLRAIVPIHKKRRRWEAFLLFLILYVSLLFFVGLELWELWALLLIVGWVRWCVRT